MGARSAGGGASGRGEERTDSAKAKIKVVTRVMAGRSLITAASVHRNKVYLDRAVQRPRDRRAIVFPIEIRTRIRCVKLPTAPAQLPPAALIHSEMRCTTVSSIPR